MLKACLLACLRSRAASLTAVLSILRRSCRRPERKRGAAAHVWGRAGRGASPRMPCRAHPYSAALGVAGMSFFGGRA